MKVDERDSLLARLDERSASTWRAVEKIEAHLDRSNSRLRKVENRVWYIFGLIAVVSSMVGVALFHALQ